MKAKVRLPNFLLALGTVICFAEMINASGEADPGPLGSAAFGLMLLRRAVIRNPQPNPVIISGCVMTAIVMAGNHGYVAIHKPIYLAIGIAAIIIYIFWERIEKRWKLSD